MSLVAAVSALGGAGSADATTVTVTAGKPAELKFTLSKRTVAKGATTFKVTNKGSLSHDFKIAGKKTATLGKGKSGTITVTFKKAGSSRSSASGHAAGGMKGADRQVASRLTTALAGRAAAGERGRLDDLGADRNCDLLDERAPIASPIGAWIRRRRIVRLGATASSRSDVVTLLPIAPM